MAGSGKFRCTFSKLVAEKKKEQILTIQGYQWATQFPLCSVFSASSSALCAREYIYGVGYCSFNQSTRIPLNAK